MKGWVLGALLLALVGDLAGAPAVTLSGRPTSADISGLAGSEAALPYRSVFFADDLISVEFTIQVDAEDQGQTRNLYLAARYNGYWFTFDPQAGWRPWNLDPGTLAVYARKPLGATEHLTALDAGRLLPGEFLVYAGYEGEAGDIVFNPVPLGFAVFDLNDPLPVRLTDAELVRKHLTEALDNPAYTRVSYNLNLWEDGIDFSADSSTAAGPGVSVSGTNVQEAGVDEADRLKSDGAQLLALAECESSIAGCLDRYRIQDQPAANQLAQRLALPGTGPVSGIYWVRGRPGGAEDLVLTLGSGVAGTPLGPVTEVHWFGLIEAGLNAQPTHAISIPGVLLASRVIGDVLYLAVGTAAGTVMVEDVVESTFGGPPIPFLRQEAALPALTLDARDHPLVQGDGCLLPAPYEPRPLSTDLAYLVALPLSGPEAFVSRCLLGPVEALYASARALYLTSARYDSLVGYELDQRVEVHKYALADGVPDYRGSASLPGHLGWEQDKKSFRFGEHQGILRVATSLNTTDKHRVTLLQEDPASGGRLLETGRVDGLGKPGEEIYAARFLGDRGYLVTFERIDPLYVLDLFDPYAPRLAGELEVPGFSDYLHPIGEDWLLGIGLDSVEVDAGECFTSWSDRLDGVKLSLFNVADPGAPEQVDSVFLPGSDSNVRSDHLALAYLPPAPGRPARLALPLRVEDNEENGKWVLDAHYCGFTQAGLYVFDVELETTPEIRQVASLITDRWPEDSSARLIGNRSLLLPNSAHYLHQGELTSGPLPPR